MITQIYRCLVYVLLPIALLATLFKGLRNRAYWRRLSERLGQVPADVVRNAPYDLLLHAVSVGEARASAPLVNAYLQENPQARVLITTTTPTGSDMVRLMFVDKVNHCYLPFDTGYAMRRFAAATKPKLSLIMETEIWPNLIHQLNNQGSKLAYINVRLSQRSFQRYARLLGLVSSTLAQVDHFAVQGEADAQHLAQLGVEPERITQTGSIKFDITLPDNLNQSAHALRETLGKERQIWVAGSTRDGEEQFIFGAFRKLKTRFPELLLIVVPRHPERFDQVAKQALAANFRVARRSQGVDRADKNVDVYIADTMGELLLMYACADVAFVGGSLLPLGGQNILEPCAVGVPVVFGPHMFNFPDISRWTLQAEAGRQVENHEQLVNVVGELLDAPVLRQEMGKNGQQLIERHRGALQKTQALLGRIQDDEKE